MEEHVVVTVRSTSRYEGGEETAVFHGRGLLRRQEGAWRLRYTASTPEGGRLASEVRLEGDCAFLQTLGPEGYTLPLDLHQTTTARIPTAAGILPITVHTRHLRWDEDGIQMAYTLLAGKETLSQLEVAIQLRKE